MVTRDAYAQCWGSRLCRLTLLSLATLQFSSTALAALPCYFPNGQRATGNYPCNPGADVSVCCGGGLGSVCLSNKLCLGSNGGIIRGACTDVNWGPGCADYCTGASTGGTDLISCTNVTGSTLDYCCDHTNNCCETGVDRFQVLPANPYQSATFNITASAYVVQPTPTSSTTSSTSASTNGSGSAGSGSTTQSAMHRAPSGLSTGGKIGLGAGIGLGVILAAVLAYGLWRRRKTEKRPSGGHGEASEELAPRRGYTDDAKLPAQLEGDEVWPRVNELGDEGARHELAQPIAELDAERR